MGNFLSRTRVRSVSPKSDEETQLDISKHENEMLARAKRNDVINNHAVLKSEGYDLFETIGFGAYAIVKRGYCEKMKKSVAIKIVNRKRIPKEVKRKFLPRELEITSFAKHENIVRCTEILRADFMIYIILEMVENGDLLKYVVKNNYIEENRARNMFMGIVSAVNYLHQHKIVHRDLKLENILLTKNLVPKLSDFGFARVSENAKLCRTFCGSAAYAPYEILSGIPYEPFKVDAWCLGVILYAMTVGYMPFSDDKHKKDIKKGVSFRESKQPIPKQLKELIRKILVMDSNARLSVADILAHDWLQNEAVETWSKEKTESDKTEHRNEG